MVKLLEFHDLESVYDSIALALDEVGNDREVLLLTKLCLVLAHNIEDVSVIQNAIEVAKLDLGGSADQ
jgi:hypothetical protein